MPSNNCVCLHDMSQNISNIHTFFLSTGAGCDTGSFCLRYFGQEKSKIITMSEGHCRELEEIQGQVQ